MHSENIKIITEEFHNSVKELDQERSKEILALAREQYQEKAQMLLGDNILYWLTRPDSVSDLREKPDISEHKLQLLDWLIGEGAEVDYCDGSGNTALARAVVNCNIEVVNSLLDHGANLHARNKRGWTPFHQACHQGSPEVIALLLDRGAHINDRATGERNITGLMLAADRLHIPIIKLLLERGADPAQADDSLLTAHHYAKYSIASMCDSGYKPSKQTADAIMSLLPLPAVSDEISNVKYSQANCPLCGDVKSYINLDNVDGWQADIRKYFIFALNSVFGIRRETEWRIVKEDTWYECPHCGSCYHRTVTEDTDDVWYPRYSMDLYRISREVMEKGIEEAKGN